MSHYFPTDIARLIGGYVMEWTVLPWVLERAPRLTKRRRDSNMILHWHGDLIGESDDIVGSGITDNGGIPVNSWDPEADKKYDDTPDAKDVEHERRDNDPYTDDADHYIWENPRCQDFVRGLTIDWVALAANPADWALDLLEQLKHTIAGGYPWNNLCRNTNPRARALWKKGRSSDLDWGWLSANPNAIEFLTSEWRSRVPDSECYIDSGFILWNPAAEKFIETEFHVDINNDKICYNQDPWPAARAVQDAIPIEYALRAGYGRNPNDYAIKRMREYTGEWTPRMRAYFYTNPNPAALEMIRDNPEKFPLAPVIWSNPAIFEQTIPKGLIEIITSIAF